jgi:hypothetical protein
VDPQDVVNPILRSLTSSAGYIQIDFSDPYPVLSDNFSFLKHIPATNPPTTSLFLEFGEDLFRLRFPLYSSTFVSIFHVIDSAHTALRMTVPRGVFSTEVYDLIHTMHRHRLRTIVDPQVLAVETEKGIRNVDRLLGQHFFQALLWLPNDQEYWSFRMVLSRKRTVTWDEIVGG